MKRIFTAVLISVVALLLVSCGAPTESKLVDDSGASQSANTESAGTTAQTETNDQSKPTSKIIDIEPTVSILLYPDDMGQSADEIISNMLGVGANVAQQDGDAVYVTFQKDIYDGFMLDFRNEMDEAALSLKAKHPGIKAITYSDDYTDVKIDSDGKEGFDALTLKVYCAYYSAYLNTVIF